MNSISLNVARDEGRLGELAMQFRGSRCEEERRDIANDYDETVERLIHSGHWHEMPSLEDQLPDDWMPPSFFAYWSRQQSIS